MVKLYPVGKKRAFARGLLLTFLTMGLYGVYWLYKVPHEVYDQFELEETGRDEGIIWLVTGLVLPLLVVIYMWKAVDNVRYVRRRFGLNDGVAPGAFVTLHLVGPLAVAAVLAVAVAGVAPDLDVAATVAALVVVGFAVAAVGYLFLQRAVNEVWDAWWARATDLKRTARPLPRPA